MITTRNAIVSLLLAAASLLLPQTARAQTRTVISDVAYIHGHILTTSPTYDFITVTCYDAGAAQCAGGGDFDRGASGCTNNDATVITDAKTPSPNCFYRKNFGLNGVVDARQCGVRGDGSTNDYTALNTCLTLAAAAKIPTVNTGGGQVIVGAHDVAIPANTELTCGGLGTATGNNDDYRLSSGLPNVLVVDPGHTVAMSSINSTFSGCNLLVSNASSNVYSPTTYYPNCTDTLVPCTTAGTAQTRSGLNEYSAFFSGPAASSTGISVSAENTVVRNVAVLGFGTCYASSSSGGATGKRIAINRLAGDCNTGIKIDGSPDATQFYGYMITPFLTRQANSTINAVVDAIAANGSGQYKATVEVATTGGNQYRYVAGDTLWIGTSAASGTESAAGRWIVGSDVTSTFTGAPCLTGKTCQSFTLKGWGTAGDSVSSPITGTGDVSNVPRNGQPATLIANVSTTRPDLISVGQGVSDTGGCIAGGTTVVDVWPAKGLVWISAQPTCAATGDSLTFTDQAFTNLSPNCASGGNSDLDNGCATTSTTLRFGDGVVISNSGGVTSVACGTFQHAVAFHVTTGANSTRFTDCNTGEDQTLPDKGIIGLLIDGDHTGADGCATSWQGGPLGQHRPAGIVIDSDCTHSQMITDAQLAATPTNQSGITAEVRAGTLAMENSVAASSGNVLFDGTGYSGQQNRLFISNNMMENTTLYISDGASGQFVTGCGNVFDRPVPYQCSPAVAVAPPKGRLTLTSGVPVMTSDAVNATVLYYAPYAGQSVPVFDPATNAFFQQDVGASGLSMNLNGTTGQLSGHVYDVFAETVDSGSVELCTGPAWTSTSARGSTAAIAQVNGIWTNAGTVTCQHNAASFTCPAFMCTYVGSLYATANGKTTMQFGPDSHAGGNGNCLCLYNAYNQVPTVSASLDSNAAYTYTATTWRAMDNSGGALNGNSVSVLDGLGQMAIYAEASSLTKGNTGASANAAKIGVDVNSTSATPTYSAQNAANQSVSITSTLRSTPVFGLWYAQGMEATSTSVSAVTFGGSGNLQVGVNVND